MKAAILVKQKSALVVDDIKLPSSLEYGQVLVKIHYSGICGAQINEIEGVKGPDKFLPHLLGHEGGGIVKKCGPGVTKVKPGDHVVLHWRKGDGIQAPTPAYKWKNKKINAGWVTTFNESAIVSENRVTPIPKKVDLGVAALYGCALTTGYGVIHNDAKLKSGQSIAVFGVGGAGSSVIMAASLAAAYPIIAVDINDFKLKKSKGFGASHTINSIKQDPKNKILKIVDSGVDVAVDTTGIREVRELAYETTNKSGTTVLVGVPKAGEKMNIDSFPLHFEKKITGSHGGDCNPSYDIPRLIRLQLAGKFDTNDMITKTFSLDQINDALDEVRKGDVIRCIIKM